MMFFNMIKNGYNHQVQIRVESVYVSLGIVR
jgi:hypothetical protein